MLVLRHDFGAKRAFLLKALRPAGLLIYFQDFRSFSNPGIRRFLTDLDPPPPPPLCLSYCRRLQFVNLNPSILTRYHTHTHTHTREVTFFSRGTHVAFLGLSGVSECKRTELVQHDE